ncbi:MAG: hypothetical protein Q4G34_06535 [Micrococcus sp.]|nr:hypothetical protein [Micrococcus sp.]
MDPRTHGGFISPWTNGSRLYRGMVIAGSALFLIGIVLSVIGASTGQLTLSWTALFILGAGVLMHMTAQVTRFREAARTHQALRGPRR